MPTAPTRSPNGDPPISGGVKVVVALCGLLVIGLLLSHRRTTPDGADAVAARAARGVNPGPGWIAKSDRPADFDAADDVDAPRMGAGAQRRLGAGRSQESDTRQSAPLGSERRASGVAGHTPGTPPATPGLKTEAPIEVDTSVAAAPLPGAPLASAARSGPGSGSPRDAAGNGLDDAAMGGNAEPGQPTPAVSAAGLAFVGGQDFSLDDEKTFPNGISISGDAGTVSFCLQPQWSGDAQTDASFISTGGDGSSFFSFGKTGETLQFTLASPDGADSLAAASIGGWQPGERHLVTAAWGDERTLLYVDGQLVDQQTYKGKLQIRPDMPLYVGSSANSGAPGALTNLQIYNRSLVGGEVGALTAGCQ